MSFNATRWAWMQRGLSPAQRCTLLSLADRAGEDNTCYPSLSRIAFDTEQDIKTIRKSIKILCEKGLITRQERIGESCTYQLVGVEEWKNSAEVSPPQVGTPTVIGTPTQSGTPTILAFYPYQFGADPLPSTRMRSREQSKEPIRNLNPPLAPIGTPLPLGGDEMHISPVQEEKTQRQTDRSAFEQCYNAYPLKQAQEEAWREWKRLKRTSDLPDSQEIIQAIQAHVSADSRWKRGKIPLMKNWLASKRWLDQPHVEGEAVTVQLCASPVEPYDNALLHQTPRLIPAWEDEVGNSTPSFRQDILAALRGNSEARKRMNTLGNRISA